MTEQNIHILLVDDDEIDQETVKRYVEEMQLPYTLQTANTTAKALELLRESAYDVILLDYLLHDGTGLDVLPHVGNTPAIFITGSGSEQVAVEAMRLNAYDYLVKDPDLNYLTVLPLTIQNVLTRKQAEEALRESQTQFQDLYDNAPNAYFSIGVDSLILRCNKRAGEFLGYTVEELVGRQVFDLYADTPHGKQKASQVFQRFQASETVTDEELQMQKADGTPVWISLTAIPIQNDRGQVVESRSIVVDITERKQVEEELYRREQEFRTLAENAPDIIFRFDHAFQHTYVNAAVEKATGIPNHAFIGKDHRELGMPEDIVLFFQMHIHKVFESGQVDEFSFSFPTPTGERYYESLYVPEFSRDGTVESVMGISRDITERKQAEEQLKTALAEKETLLKEVYHRVKNNLGVLNYLIDLQAGEIEDPQILDAFGELQGRVRAMGLVHQKLYQTKDLARIDFGEYLEDMTSDLFYALSGDRSITLRVEAENVFIDVNLAITCGLIVNELVTNALKYAFPASGGGQANYEIRIEFGVQEEEYILTVSDNGAGLPPELDWRTTESLGLRLVNGWANQLGGSLEVDGRQGTTFTIRFKERR